MYWFLRISGNKSAVLWFSCFLLSVSVTKFCSSTIKYKLSFPFTFVLIYNPRRHLACTPAIDKVICIMNTHDFSSRERWIQWKFGNSESTHTQIGTSKNSKLNLFLHPCSKSEIMRRIILRVNGSHSLNDERCNPVTSCPGSRRVVERSRLFMYKMYLYIFWINKFTKKLNVFIWNLVIRTIR
jgi:hypothetical protein